MFNKLHVTYLANRCRGRQKMAHWKVNIFTFRKTAPDFLPGQQESAFLSQIGLG